MNSIIIEDEIPAAIRLKRLLENRGFIVLATLNSVRDSLFWLAKNSEPDYIFADIQLRDGLSFSIFSSVKIQSKIIFTTAYDEFALRAFDFNSLDYILKPINESKLDRLLSKIEITTHSKLNESNFSIVREHLENRFTTSFLVSTGNAIKKVESAEIAHFVSENNVTFIIVATGRNYPIESSLEKLESNLCPYQFFRISRKYIVNRKNIVSFSHRYLLQVDCGTQVDLRISRSKYKLFVTWYTK